MSHPSTANVWFPVPAWVWGLLVLACVVASVTDLRDMRIPNWLTMPLLGLGVAYGAWVGALPGVGQSLLGLTIAGVIFIGAYMLAGGGAGDAKLMMALGAWLGAERSALLVMSVGVAGLLWAIVITIWRGGFKDVPVMLFHSLFWFRNRFWRLVRGSVPVAQTAPTAPQPRFKGWYPYAPAILVGTAGAWWYWETRGSIV
jgi:prepilin peptidase CpaA